MLTRASAGVLADCQVVSSWQTSVGMCASLPRKSAGSPCSLLTQDVCLHEQVCMDVYLYEKVCMNWSAAWRKALLASLGPCATRGIFPLGSLTSGSFQEPYMERCRCHAEGLHTDKLFTKPWQLLKPGPSPSPSPSPSISKSLAA
jgi:hypothetical protein